MIFGFIFGNSVYGIIALVCKDVCIKDVFRKVLVVKKYKNLIVGEIWRYYIEIMVYYLVIKKNEIDLVFI